MESSWPQDICGMSRLRLSHWFSSHLSVVFYTVAPALIAVIYLYFFSSSFFSSQSYQKLPFYQYTKIDKIATYAGSSWQKSLHSPPLPYFANTCKVFVIVCLELWNFIPIRKARLHFPPASLWPCHRFGEFLLPGVCLPFPFSHSLSVSLCTLYLQVDISKSTFPCIFRNHTGCL